jgi:hypothetical protein
MAFTKDELERVQAILDEYLRQKEPPPQIRPQLNYSYVIDRQSVQLREVRPYWNDPSIKISRPYAKATYVRRSKDWSVFWLRGDMKWRRYDHTPTVAGLADFLFVVEEDKEACFYG